MTNRDRTAAATCVYLGGFIIGLTLVSFPASSIVLRTAHGFSNAQYGAIYIPQLAAAVLGALGGGAASRVISLRAMFLAALGCFCAAEILLALSLGAAPTVALAMIMAATAAFGFGFGFGGGPLNAFAALLFPERQGSAVTALHMCAGAGLTLAPVYFAALADEGLWVAGPISLAATSAMLLALALVTRFPAPAPPSAGEPAMRHPGRSLFFWMCAGAAMLYSVAEGTFSNWAILFLTEERGLEPARAALALTCFWAALTAGRLLATVIAARIPPTTFLLTLPVLMMGTLFTLPWIDGPITAYAGFAMAGLSCSAFFPMLVAFTAGRSPDAISWIASMLTAAMMVGVGIGSYAVGALRGNAPIAALYGEAVLAPLLCLACVVASIVLMRRTAR